MDITGPSDGSAGLMPWCTFVPGHHFAKYTTVPEHLKSAFDADRIGMLLTMPRDKRAVIPKARTPATPAMEGRIGCVVKRNVLFAVAED